MSGSNIDYWRNGFRTRSEMRELSKKKDATRQRAKMRARERRAAAAAKVDWVVHLERELKLKL
jgi:hypothetical protein